MLKTIYLLVPLHNYTVVSCTVVFTYVKIYGSHLPKSVCFTLYMKPVAETTRCSHGASSREVK